MYWLFLLWVIDTGTFAKDYVQSSTYLLDLTYMRVVQVFQVVADQK